MTVAQLGSAWLHLCAVLVRGCTRYKAALEREWMHGHAWRRWDFKARHFDSVMLFKMGKVSSATPQISAGTHCGVPVV